MTRRLLLILTCFTLVSGCGFALRGNVTLPAALNTLSITGGEPELVDELENALEVAGVSIVDEGTEGASSMRFTLAEFDREVRTTDSNGLATSYDLRYRVGYDVRDTDGEELQINQTLVQKRVFDYNPLQQLQSEEEESFLKEEMRGELVLQILRRLSRI